MSTKARCQAHLDELRREHHGVAGTLLSTMDGFEVAASVGDQISPGKLAAMASSLLALAEAVSRESAVGQCRDLVIESSAGLVLLMDVPSSTHKAVLTVLCTEAAVFGRIRWAARNTRGAGRLGHGFVAETEFFRCAEGMPASTQLYCFRRARSIERGKSQ